MFLFKRFILTQLWFCFSASSLATKQMLTPLSASFTAKMKRIIDMKSNLSNKLPNTPSPVWIAVLGCFIAYLTHQILHSYFWTFTLYSLLTTIIYLFLHIFFSQKDLLRVQELECWTSITYRGYKALVLLSRQSQFPLRSGQHWRPQESCSPFLIGSSPMEQKQNVSLPEIF